MEHDISKSWGKAILGIGLSQEEYELYERAAQACDMGICDWARLTLRTEAYQDIADRAASDAMDSEIGIVRDSLRDKEPCTFMEGKCIVNMQDPDKYDGAYRTAECKTCGKTNWLWDTDVFPDLFPEED